MQTITAQNQQSFVEELAKDGLTDFKKDILLVNQIKFEFDETGNQLNFQALMQRLESDQIEALSLSLKKSEIVALKPTFYAHLEKMVFLVQLEIDLR